MCFLVILKIEKNLQILFDSGYQTIFICKTACKTRLKNMLVSVTRDFFFEHTRPVGKIFFYFEMEKIALILIYLTRFLSSSLRSIFCA